MTLNCETKKRRAGFSLMELAVVLAVVGVILGALWGIVSIVRENIRRETALSQVSVIVASVRDFYLGRGFVQTPSGQGDFDKLTDYLIRQGVIPPEAIRDRSATTLRADLPWGPTGAGGSTLADGGLAIDNTDVGVSADRFRVQLRGLSYANCIALSSRLSGPEGPKGLMRVKINSNADEELPVTVEEASDSCQKKPGGDENKVDFVFRLRGH